jgi:cysteine rich repeat protein
MPARHKILWVPTIAATLGLSFALFALFHPPAFAQGRACADDVAKFCTSVKDKPAQAMQCLKAHQSDLSADCRSRLQATDAQMKEVSDACQSDVQRFCSDVSPGGGCIAQCLKQHQSELFHSLQIRSGRGTAAAAIEPLRPLPPLPSIGLPGSV